MRKYIKDVIKNDYLPSDQKYIKTALKLNKEEIYSDIQSINNFYGMGKNEIRARLNDYILTNILSKRKPSHQVNNEGPIGASRTHLDNYNAQLDQERIRHTSGRQQDKDIAAMKVMRYSDERIRQELKKNTEEGKYQTGKVVNTLYNVGDALSYLRHPLASAKGKLKQLFGFEIPSQDTGKYKEVRDALKDTGDKAAISKADDMVKAQGYLNATHALRSQNKISKGRYYRTTDLLTKGIHSRTQQLNELIDNAARHFIRDPEDEKKEGGLEKKAKGSKTAAAILLFVGVSTFILAFISPQLTGYTILASGTHVPSGIFIGTFISLLGILYHKTKR
jgi:rRNA maturation endonuclease Nob1